MQQTLTDNPRFETNFTEMTLMGEYEFLKIVDNYMLFCHQMMLTILELNKKVVTHLNTIDLK